MMRVHPVAGERAKGNMEWRIKQSIESQDIWSLVGILALRDVGPSPSALHESLFAYKEKQRDLIFVNNPHLVERMSP